MQDGFSILLSAKDHVRLFGDNIKLSCIAAVPQTQRKPRLILNLSAPPDKETPSVNDTMGREISPESMQFGREFPRILLAIWEEHPEEGPVRVSKLDVTDAYHRGTLTPSQVGAFAYIVPRYQMKISFSYASTWCYRWDGWTHPSFSVFSHRRPLTWRTLWSV